MLALFGLMTANVMANGLEPCETKPNGKPCPQYCCSQKEHCYYHPAPVKQCLDYPVPTEAPSMPPTGDEPCETKPDGSKCPKFCCDQKPHCAYYEDSCQEACGAETDARICKEPGNGCEWNTTTRKCVPEGTVPCDEITVASKCDAASIGEARPKGCMFNHDMEARGCKEECEELTKGYSCKRHLDMCNYDQRSKVCSTITP